MIHRLAFGPVLNGKWEKTRLGHAIRLGRQSHVKTGKNSADIELTITAMELLIDESISGFFVVSSDSDFTPLVMRLREAGRLVIGFGEKKAPEGFVEACDRYEMIGEAKNTNGKPGTKAGGQVPGTPLSELSSGTRMQLLLALRMAWIETLERVERHCRCFSTKR